MFYIEPMYLVFAIPGLIVAGLASMYTHTMFMEYSRKRASSGMTGAEAAARMLSRAGINDVRIERVDGFLSDHYDPLAKTLRLSPKVYDEDSLSAIGVACHEAGHALQHAAGYVPMHIRSQRVPMANIGSYLSYGAIILGFILQAGHLVMLGAILFSAVVLFSIVTLPVEWDASARAKKLMVSSGIVSEQERDGAGKVLNAAFMTYVAAVISSLLTLLYYLLRASSMNRD